ncbi:MAG: ABC transporter permease subunit [Anaerolineales bacterium]|nr:ABC transporter permease subunit [Anaerolineales bacterium]
MNIFLRELKANLKSLLIWSFIVVLFVTIGFSKFSAYYGNPELLAVLNGMPPALLEAFNMNAFNLTTLSGFYGVMFAYFALLVSIAAAMWGSDIISKEERDKTVEFALTLPITRNRLVAAKTLAALVNCIALALLAWGATAINASGYEPDREFYQFLALGTLALFLMQLIFLAIGIFLGCALKQHKRASSAAVAVLLGTYFISIIAGLYKDMEFLKYLTPFQYFNPVVLLHESKLELPFVGLSLAIMAVALAGAFLTYNRRDLYI